MPEINLLTPEQQEALSRFNEMCEEHHLIHQMRHGPHGWEDNPDCICVYCQREWCCT